MSARILTFEEIDDPMPTRNRAERRKRARHHRRAHGAWRAAVHREALLTERAWARTHGAWKRSDCWFRRRQWLAERMYDAWQAKRALPPRPHFQTLSAWMAAQR